jgi:striatin 1/3/4
LDSQDELGGESNAPGATAVEAIKADLKRVAVAYQNAVVKIFDIESGKEVSRLPSDLSYGIIPAFSLHDISCLISTPYRRYSSNSN